MSQPQFTEGAPRVVLVTGGARRIGAAIVRRFAAGGALVAIHCRSSRDVADALAAELNEGAAGERARVFAADLSERAAPARLVEDVVQGFGRLDVVVHNASTFESHDMRTVPAETVLDAFDRDVALHARAALAMALAAAPVMRDQAQDGRCGGALVLLGDAHLHRRRHAAYAASKAALMQLTRSLALDLAPEVRVNCVAPGAVLPADHAPGEFERIVRQVPMLRAGTPEEVAEAVHWFAHGPEYVTGQTLNVDGGRHG